MLIIPRLLIKLNKLDLDIEEMREYTITNTNPWNNTKTVT